jgi:hypothetical protein
VVALIALLGYALWPRPADVVLPPSGEGDTLEVVITVVAGRAQVLRADGTVLGTTPYRIKGPRNSKHSLLLRQEGYHDEIINVEVNERRQEYPITMDRVRR